MRGRGVACRAQLAHIGLGEVLVSAAQRVGHLTRLSSLELSCDFVRKSGRCDSGYSCRLTVPSILRGSNFCIEPISSASRRIFYFDCTGYRLVADILMKFGD